LSYFYADKNTNSILLLEKFNNEMEQLTPMEIFTLFVRKNGPYANFKKDEKTNDLKFYKKPIDLKFKINLLPKISSISFFLSIDEERELNLDISRLLEFGYCIIDSIWYPISEESKDELYKNLDKYFTKKEIETYLALKIINDPNFNFQIYSKRNLTEVFEETQEKGSQIIKGQLFEKDLYSYQERGVSWLKFCVTNKIGSILGDDMGLGKTAQVIALISWMLENNIGKKILIVVPSTLLENWRREFLFFSPSVVPYIHHGSQRIGVASSFAEYNVIVTSYSLVINDFFLLNDINWDLTVLDEASLIKNPDSERTKRIKELNSSVRVAMTGTPVENSLTDLWSITDYVFPNYFGDLESFKERYIARNITETLDKDLSSLRSATSQIMLRRMKEDILEGLPDKIDIHQALVMNDQEKIRYEEIRSEILSMAETNKGLCFKLINDLRQFTTHPVLLDEGNFDRSNMNLLSKQSKKFERTIEILDEVSEKGEKVLIFTGFIKMIDILIDFLKVKYKCNIFNIDGRVETSARQEQIDLFSQERGFSIMVLNPTTAAMGLNITAANHVIHYTRQWNPAIEIQASARAYRNGQKLGVNVYYLFYVNTIEETMDNRLKQKQQLSSEVVSVVEHSDDEANEILKILKKE
jgi:SNF2 family DNA or RNA helicase